MKKILAAFALALPTAAMAQTVNTNCTQDYFGNVNCTSRQGGITIPDSSAMNRNFLNQMAEQQRQQDERESEQRAQRAGRMGAMQQQRAAQMVAAGDCAGAQSYALEQGNFTLAQQVKDYCQ